MTDILLVWTLNKIQISITYNSKHKQQAHGLLFMFKFQLDAIF